MWTDQALEGGIRYRTFQCHRSWPFLGPLCWALPHHAPNPTLFCTSPFFSVILLPLHCSPQSLPASVHTTPYIGTNSMVQAVLLVGLVGALLLHQHWMRSGCPYISYKSLMGKVAEAFPNLRTTTPFVVHRKQPNHIISRAAGHSMAL